MKKSFTLKKQFPVAPSLLYTAWLDSEEHSKMTGGEAKCSKKIGDTFTAWDEYISGRNLDLTENKEIVQSWRTVEFSEEDEDSNLIISLAESEGGTELTLTHSNIPEGQPDYEQGWVDNYLDPMKDYFGL